MSKWTKEPEIIQIKDDVRVLLLGSYRDGCLTRLKNIRDAIKLEFDNVRLAIDFEYPKQGVNEIQESYNLRASEYWLNNSDLQIFIFFKQTDNASVAIELATHLYKFAKSSSTVVGVYENCPSLLAGLSKRFEPSLSYFTHNSDEDIISYSKGTITSRLKQFYPIVSYRQSFDWEKYTRLNK